MPYTKCPYCRKVQQVTPALVFKEVGCMDAHCGGSFKAREYRMHSGPLSRAVFYGFIAFALFLGYRWLWMNSSWIMYSVTS